MGLLILFILYILPVIGCWVFYYINWCKHNNGGDTIGDLFEFIQNSPWSCSPLFVSFIPIVNYVEMVSAASQAFEFRNIKIRNHAKSTKTKRH